MSLCATPLLPPAKYYCGQDFPSSLPKIHQRLNLVGFCQRSKNLNVNWGSSRTDFGEKIFSKRPAVQAYFGFLGRQLFTVKFTKRQIKETEIVKVNEKKLVVKEVIDSTLTVVGKIGRWFKLQTLPIRYENTICDNLLLDYIGKVVVVTLTAYVEYKGYVISVGQDNSLMLENADEYFQGKYVRHLGNIRCDRFMAVYLPEDLIYSAWGNELMKK